MDLTRKSEIKNLLKKYNAKPEKYLGQHFLLSKNALTLILAAAEIKNEDTILEIGPGLGTLTKELAKTGAKIVTIEKDPLMLEILKETLANYRNVKIVQADALQLLIYEINSFGDKVGISIGRIGKDKYKVVANLPYNIATFLIRSWLEIENPPKIMVLMIQKEVAQRICAKPPHMNLLAVSTQFLAIAEIISYVPKKMFWPKPKVDAAIIKIVPRKVTVFQRSLEKQQFFRIVKAGFSSPRKQLAGNLSKKLNIPKEKVISIFKDLNILEQVRAENLSLEQWQSIVHKLTQ